MKLVEKLHKHNRVYTGKSVHFAADEIILPDGNKAIREYMEHPGAVAILPFADKNNIILVKQYRFPVKEVTFEVPAGKMGTGEKPLACAKRELTEETGFRAKKIKKVLSFWPTAAFSDEVIHIFTATDLVQATKSPDEDEFIDHVIVPFKQALEWVRTGKIRDSKTVIALLFHATLGK